MIAYPQIEGHNDLSVPSMLISALFSSPFVWVFLKEETLQCKKNNVSFLKKIKTTGYHMTFDNEQVPYRILSN